MPGGAVLPELRLCRHMRSLGASWPPSHNPAGESEAMTLLCPVSRAVDARTRGL